MTAVVARSPGWIIVRSLGSVALGILLVFSTLALTAVADRPALMIPLLLLGLYLAAVTPELVRIDLRLHRLPNRLVMPGYLVAALALGGVWIIGGSPPWGALVTAATAAGVFGLMNLLGGMGMGDVKLAVLLGLMLGTVGGLVWNAPSDPSVRIIGALTPGIIALVLAFGLGALGGLVVIITGRRTGEGRLKPAEPARIAFGPFLLAGFWLAIAATPLLTPV